MAIHIRRREFLFTLGAAAAWPLAAWAQQPTPVIGYLNSRGPDDAAHLVAAFRRGLRDGGFIDGQNVRIEFRWGRGRFDSLKAMAEELCLVPVSVLVATGGDPAVVAAKAATSAIPIVFGMSSDPIKLGLAASFNRPGGNATGMVLVSGQLGQKRLELVRDLVPKAATVAMLANPLSPDAPPEIREVQAAAQANGLQLRMLNASTPGEIEAAFASLSGQRPDALLVGGDPFYMARREDIVRLAARSGLVTVYPFRESPKPED
jgi:putative ABC transport system substrate-binding protein